MRIRPEWIKKVDLKPRRCRSCGALIYWCITTNGKRMPLELEERTAIFTERKGGERKLLEILETVFRSHFATCRDAGKWRKEDR